MCIRDRAEVERDELQAKLDAAGDRPTLDREAVGKIIERHFKAFAEWARNLAVNELMELVPSSWPEWLGPKINPDDYEVTRVNEYAFDVGGARWCYQSGEEVREHAVQYATLLAVHAAIARFIESEQAATGDEDQRVEEQAKALYCTLNPCRPMAWHQLAEDERENCRAAIRAGWSKGGAA